MSLNVGELERGEILPFAARKEYVRWLERRRSDVGFEWTAKECEYNASTVLLVEGLPEFCFQFLPGIHCLLEFGMALRCRRIVGLIHD